MAVQVVYGEEMAPMNRIPTLRWALGGPYQLSLPRTWEARSEGRSSRVKYLVVLGATLIALAWLLPWHLGRVRGSSMTPTLQPGSFFLYERGQLRPDQLRRGDIIVLRHAGELWIKRVYARAGDSILLWHENDGTTVRRVPIHEADLARYERLAAWIRRRGSTQAQVVRQQIPAGHVFVLGDDWLSSIDSRTLGPISAAQIAGRVIPLPGQHLEKRPEPDGKIALIL